jgi:signal transduction histidine kinase
VSSLRRRLHRVLLVLLGGMAVQWFLADRMIVYAGEREMETRLQHDADSLFSTLVLDANGAPNFDPRSAGTIYTRAYSGHYFVMQANGRRIESPSFGDAPPFDVPADARDSLDHVAGPHGQPLLMLTTHIDVGGTRVTLAVGEDLSDLRRELLEFRLLFLALSLTVLGGAAALQSRELRWALRPLDTIRDAVLQLQRGGKPVAAVDAPVEIRPLIDEINRLLAFVERRLQQSRTAIGNLSHALKTPLTALFRLLDDPHMSASPELRRTIQEQADAINVRIDRELKRARLAGSEPTRDTFDAPAELPALVRLLHQIHRDKPLTIDWTAPEGTISFDREDMLELIGNLADNACKWAASRVTIEIRERDGLDIVVSDDGPGCTDEKLASLGTRGTREDESVPGYGLGLAIARDIVEFAGGRLRFARSAMLGGFEVTAHFPAGFRTAPTA